MHTVVYICSMHGGKEQRACHQLEPKDRVAKCYRTMFGMTNNFGHAAIDMQIQMHMRGHWARMCH